MHSLLKRSNTLLLGLLAIFACTILSTTYLWRNHHLDRVAKLLHANHVDPPQAVSHALVMGKVTKEDVKWAYSLEPKWTPYIYSVDGEEGYPLKVPANKGREAMVYLTFIIDNYDGLPEITVFVHANPVQWHNDVVGDRTSEVISNLRIDTVQRKGYVNLRCHSNPGCPFSVFPKNPTETDIKNDDTRAHFVEIYMDIFNVTEAEVPETIAGICCAQFAVSRTRILQRPKADYIRMRDWILTTKLDTFGVGWVFEMMWHIVFGEDAVHCPKYEQCRCDLYGWCSPVISEDH